MGRRSKGRANGEGSIYQDKDGQWWAQISLADGRLKRKRASTQRDAREKLEALRASRDQGLNLAARQPTVSEWCAIWLEKYTRNLKPNIRDDYRGVVRRYIDSASLGKRRLNQLTPAMVQDWVDALGQRIAPQTVRNAHARLHTALAVAVKRRYIAHNVADDTDLPQVRPRPIQPLDFAQASALLAAVEGHRWGALYRLAINLGLRQGELLGLTWDAIDFATGTIRVSQQLRRVVTPEGGKAFVLQTTKTKAGERLLTLDDDLVAVLRAHRSNQMEEHLVLGPKWKNAWGLVFVSETGRPIHVSNLTDHFQRALAAAELPVIRFHDLRHTAATLMLADSVPLVTVSKILGHSSPAVTAKIYAHALDSSKASAIAGLSQRLRRTS